jgi:hypothetical protein
MILLYSSDVTVLKNKEDQSMRLAIVLCLILLSARATADVAQVNIWTPYPGKAAEMYQNAIQAKAIHEKLGASVSIAQDQYLNMHYVVIFKDWSEHGKFSDALGSSEEWQAFWQKISAESAAELTQTFTINNPVVAEPKPVSVVFSWDVDAGRTPDFIAICEGAMPIHKRLGASPGINIDELGNVHYELTFDNWEAWGNYAMKSATDEEWNAYFAKHSENPVATLTRVWRINVME